MQTATQHITYYNNRLAVSAGWMYKDIKVLSKSNYDWMNREGKINVLRNGGGANRPALVEYESLPDKYKAKIVGVLGKSPYDLYKSHWFEQYLTPNYKARNYFETWTLPNGKHLPESVIQEYSVQVMFLQALSIVKKEKKHLRKVIATNEKFDFWERISDIINSLQEKYQHNLPPNAGALRNKFAKFKKEDFQGVISGKYGNRNNLKSSPQVISAVLSLYVMDNIPFAETVHKYYTEFLDGKREIYNQKTGEVLFPDDFVDKKGNRLDISKSLVHNIINMPQYQDLRESLREEYGKYKLNKSQFVRRKLPEFSMSKISIDDRLLGKTASKEEVWWYAAYEPLSQCFIGGAYAKDSADTDLVLDMFRNLYQNSVDNGIYWAGEIEHEHHLMDGLAPMMDAMFSFRRECNPSNSREKRIEHGFKILKYGAEKEIFENVGRWYGKGVFKNKPGYKEKRNYDEYVADHLRAVALHNNTEHPLFKGKTRIQVLMEKMNPQLSMPNGFRILKHIGFKTKTSIQRSDFCQVQYQDYLIDRTKMNLLKPYKYDVQAYWLPNSNGVIEKVYIYQDDTFICTGTLAEEYNEAQMERTEKDEAIRLEQNKHLQKHIKQRNEQKEELIFKAAMLNTEQYDVMNEIDDDNVLVEIEPTVKRKLTDDEIMKKALESTEFYEELAENTF